jgi:hypothetical protein
MSFELIWGGRHPRPPRESRIENDDEHRLQYCFGPAEEHSLSVAPEALDRDRTTLDSYCFRRSLASTRLRQCSRGK